MMGMKGVGQAVLKAIAEGRAPKPEETGITATEVAQRLGLPRCWPSPEYPPIDIAAINRVRRILLEHNVDPRQVGLTIPEQDFFEFRRAFLPEPRSEGSGMRIFDIEILRGLDGVLVWFGSVKMVTSRLEALEAEILRCLGRDRVRELPKSASSNGVSPSTKTIGEVAIAACAAGRDNRNPNSLAHLSYEAKVIAAKEAIAAYARNKQLPSAAHLALFREIDYARACNDSSHRAWNAPVIDDIKRNDHSLSAEPLSRAIDQIWVRESSGSYADLISSRAERLAELVCRGDSAADGERG